MSEKDNTELTPAEENPWYVLATLHGDGDGDGDGDEVDYVGRLFDALEGNKQAWNAWAISMLSEEQKQFVARERSEILDTLPECVNIKQETEKKFEKRLSKQSLSCLDGKIDFQQTNFPKQAHFKDFIFPEYVLFSEAIFSKDADFSGAIFFGGADFVDVTFSEDTNFGKAIFFDSVDFYYATFKKEVIFSQAVCKEIIFLNAIFDGRSYFYGAEFKENSNFMGCQFNKPCSLREAKFQKRHPMLEGAIFHEKTTITAKKEFWPDSKKCEQDPETSKESCANLRHLMNTQGLPEQAHFFFRREMFFASKIGSLVQRMPYKLFGLLSDYGHSLKRPTWALAMLWFFPAMVYWPYLYIGGYTDIFNLEFWNSVARTSALSFGLSLGNLFQFTGLQRVYLIDIIKGLPWGLKFLGGAQTLLAIPLLFLLLLGLRNRFRLK
jgi:uncharacterized protein YjbI with pentapeptide repeats